MLWRMMDQEAFFCIFAFARCVYKERPMPKSRAKKNPNLCHFNIPTSVKAQNQSQAVLSLLTRSSPESTVGKAE